MLSKYCTFGKINRKIYRLHTFLRCQTIERLIDSVRTRWWQTCAVCGRSFWCHVTACWQTTVTPHQVSSCHHRRRRQPASRRLHHPDRRRLHHHLTWAAASQTNSDPTDSRHVLRTVPRQFQFRSQQEFSREFSSKGHSVLSLLRLTVPSLFKRWRLQCI